MIEKNISRPGSGCLLVRSKIFLAVFFGSLSVFSASAQNSRNAPRRVSQYMATDSVVYEETEIVFKQGSYLPLLKGDWNITVMQEQARMAPQALTGINLVINEDSTFSVFTSCGKATGQISLKGSSIKFNNAEHTLAQSCVDASQVEKLLGLLSKRVSSYAVTSTTLTLRDGSANNVFEATPSK